MLISGSANNSSYYIDTVVDVYGEDLDKNFTKLEMGVGTGSKLALDFYLDTNGLFRKDIKPTGFYLNMGAHSEVFDIRAVAKLVKPGFKNTFTVAPIEVVATERLAKVSKAKRKCLFSHETKDHVTVFTTYSQAGCKFECMLKHASQKCHCFPWNMPQLDQTLTGQRLDICDTLGYHCFNTAHPLQY